MKREKTGRQGLGSLNSSSQYKNYQKARRPLISSKIKKKLVDFRNSVPFTLAIIYFVKI